MTSEPWRGRDATRPRRPEGAECNRKTREHGLVCEPSLVERLHGARLLIAEDGAPLGTAIIGTPGAGRNATGRGCCGGSCPTRGEA